MSVTVIKIPTDELDIVNGFRKSFNRSHDTFTEADAGLIRRGMADGHTEPFRHTFASFGIECSIGCARQVMTHKRYLAISEHSTRYSEMTAEFVVPPFKQQIGKSMDYQFEPLLPGDAEAAQHILETAYRLAYAAYRSLLHYGVAREDARSVLPLGIQTSLIASGDLIAWLRFLARRTDPHAQDEIRGIAHEIEGHLAQAFPHSLAAWVDAGRRAP